MSEERIKEYLAQRDYDVRKSGYGRWIDQKCTPDIVWSVADFVLNYIKEYGEDAEFTVKDIWYSDYAKEFIAEEFNKPAVDSPKASNEYDKIFSQPLNLLCYAGIIEDIGPGARHLYVVTEPWLLAYIARNDTFSYRFLCLYIEEVLEDSGLMPAFDDFFYYQTRESYLDVKTTFEQFCYNHTKIRNRAETGRIFTKVINPLACKYGKCGTESGRISRYPIPKQDIMYNRSNFRDIYSDKPKGVSRKEWETKQGVNYGYLQHQLVAAKRTLREFNEECRGGRSELTVAMPTRFDDKAHATQIHHIFPRNSYPILQAYLENLIALTPNQHFGFAHPDNHTQYIDPGAQRELLMAKTASIKRNLASRDEDSIYDFQNFLFVLSTGWDDEGVLEIEEDDYIGVMHAINVHYQ